MSLVIDLAEIRASDRAKHWSDLIRSEYLDLNIRFSRDRFPSGKMVRAPAGAITMTAAQSVPQTHERTKVTAEADDVSSFFGVMFLRGSAHLAQEGREVDVRPGQFVLLDSAEAYRMDFQDDYQMLFMTIPREVYPGLWRHKKELFNVRIGERNGGAIVTNYFRRMAQCFDNISAEQRECMSVFGSKLLLEAVARCAGVCTRHPFVTHVP